MRQIAVVASSTALAISIALPGPVLAQSARTFVSGLGSDASSSCSRTAPCRTLQHAHDETNANGEIDILDPAGYGAIVINRAISIVNDGVGTASVLVPSGGVGVTINVGATEAVSLRGITVEGAGAGATGIQFNTGKSLTIANGVIRHVTGSGLLFQLNSTGNLAVSNTVASDNGGHGIFVVPSGSGTVTAVLNHVETNNNTNIGIIVNGQLSTGTVNATVSDSVASNNLIGVDTLSVSGKAPTTLTVFHSVVANNATGIVANGGGATLRLGQSVLAGNTNGWQIFNGGVLQSYQDNYIDGNGANQGAPPTLAKK